MKRKYVVMREDEYMVFETLEDAEDIARTILLDDEQGAFWIAKLCEKMWVEKKLGCLKEKTTDEEETKEWKKEYRIEEAVDFLEIRRKLYE